MSFFNDLLYWAVIYFTSWTKKPVLPSSENKSPPSILRKSHFPNSNPMNSLNPNVFTNEKSAILTSKTSPQDKTFRFKSHKPNHQKSSKTLQNSCWSVPLTNPFTCPLGSGATRSMNVSSISMSNYRKWNKPQRFTQAWAKMESIRFCQKPFWEGNYKRPKFMNWNKIINLGKGTKLIPCQIHRFPKLMSPKPLQNKMDLSDLMLSILIRVFPGITTKTVSVSFSISTKMESNRLSLLFMMVMEELAVVISWEITFMSTLLIINVSQQIPKRPLWKESTELRQSLMN